MSNCVNHPQVRAEYGCQWCNNFFCGACVKVIPTRTGSMASCNCGGGCVALSKQSAKHRPAKPRPMAPPPPRPNPVQSSPPPPPGQIPMAHSGPASPPPIPTAQPANQVYQAPLQNYAASGGYEVEAEGYLKYFTAFGYPFNVNGLLLIILALAGYGISILLTFSPLASFLFAFLYNCFLAACFKNIVVSTSDGHDEQPSWSEFSDMWSDIVRPGLQFLLCTFVVFLPAFIGIYYGQPWIVIAILSLLGMLYWPMALVAICVTDHFFSIFYVHVILRSIFLVFPGYVLVLALGVFVWLGIFLSVGLLALVHPFLSLLSLVFMYYFLIVQMRQFGLLYALNEEKLEWFG